MKYAVRAFVAALVLTGAIASTHAATSKPSVKSLNTISLAPTPTCPPGSGGCGW